MLMAKRKWPYGRLEEIRRMLVTVGSDTGWMLVTYGADVGDVVLI